MTVPVFKWFLKVCPGERLLLFSLVVTAMSLRWLAWARSGIMFNDGPAFIQLAQAAAERDWLTLASHDYHPLYSVLIALFHSLLSPFGSWANVGAAVSILFSGICVLALYSLLRSEFGTKAAALGTMLFVIHERSIDYFSDVMSEGVYVTFFVIALLCVSRSLSAPRLRWFIGTGVASGFAYLVRPEGLGPVFILGLLLVWELVRGRITRKSFGLYVLALLASVAFIASPYVFSIWKVTGQLVLTHKKPILELTGVNPFLRSLDVPIAKPQYKGVGSFGAGISFLPTDEADGWVAGGAPVSDVGLSGGSEKNLFASLGRALHKLIGAIVSTARLEWILPIILGLWFSRGRPGGRGLWMGLVAVAYGVLLLGLATYTGYVSKRHVFPVILPLLGYAGIGLGELIRFLEKKTTFSVNTSRMLVLIPLVLFSLSTQIEPRRQSRAAVRIAAEWYRDNHPLNVPIAAEKQRVAFYAGVSFVPVGCTRCPLGPDRDEPSLRAAYMRGARFLISDKEEWNVLAKSLGLPIMYRVERNKRVARVYDLNKLF